MKAIWWLVLVACSDKAAPHAREHDDDHGSAPAGDKHEHGPRSIEIAADMMRDLRVTIGKAQSRASGETVSALGELRVNEDAYAEVASPVSARVTKVLAKPGDKVVAGQLLVELSSPDLGQARAEVAAARSRYELARTAADRKRALAADRLIPEREVLEADAALGEADAAYKVAASALRKFGGATGDSALAIKAPIAGTIIERTVVVGQLADPAKTLFRVGELSTLWLIAHVFERDAVRVRPGATATAAFAALPGKTTTGVIQWIGHEVDKSSRTIEIRLDVANPDGVLRPGMSASVSLPLGEAGANPVVVIPAASVQRVGAGWAVFIPHDAGHFEIRAIGRGRDLAREVEVLTGLKSGESVVIDGAFLLKAESDKQGGGGGHEH
ncbi:MAG: efflux RND transporter periplasmic adaptor subunit [Kofleriaceae bacterium]